MPKAGVYNRPEEDGDAEEWEMGSGGGDVGEEAGRMK